MHWQTIDKAPSFDPSSDEIPDPILVWVEGYGARFGEVIRRKSGERQPRAHGLRPVSEFSITHFAYIEPPHAKDPMREALEEAQKALETLWKYYDREGHGGSPGEWIVETMDQVNTALKTYPRWVPKDMAHSLYNAIEHGDQDHREWLRKAILDYLEGRPVERPCGMGQTESLMMAMNKIFDVLEIAHSHWDNARDSRVGKILGALLGHVPGYRQDIDEIRAAWDDARTQAGWCFNVTPERSTSTDGEV